MANESSIIIGSGLLPAKQNAPYNPRTNERYLRGTAMVLLNPEDASYGMGGQITQLTMSSGVPYSMPSEPIRYRRAVTIKNYNENTGTVYIGFTSGVNSSNGFPLSPQEKLEFNITAAITLWGVSDSTIDVRIIELA